MKAFLIALLIVIAYYTIKLLGADKKYELALDLLRNDSNE